MFVIVLVRCQERRLRLSEEELSKRSQLLAKEQEHYKEEAATAVQRLKDQQQHQLLLNKRIAADTQKQNEVVKVRARGGSDPVGLTVTHLRCCRAESGGHDRGSAQGTRRGIPQAQAGL